MTACATTTYRQSSDLLSRDAQPGRTFEQQRYRSTASHRGLVSPASGWAGPRPIPHERWVHILSALKQM